MLYVGQSLPGRFALYLNHLSQFGSFSKISDKSHQFPSLWLRMFCTECPDPFPPAGLIPCADRTGRDHVVTLLLPAYG
jgi:hypothetical protein